MTCTKTLRHILVITGILAVCHASVSAQVGNMTPDSVSGTPDANDRRSVLTRDPFWPVGFIPKQTEADAAAQQSESAEAVVETGTDWKKAMEQISIQGVSSRAGNESFAVINGEIKSAGETVAVSVGRVRYTWVIDSISPPSSVQLRRVSADAVAGL